MDPLSWIIPTIIAAIVSFIVVGLNRFTKTADSTITGIIEIKGLQENLSNLKDDMEKSFEKVEKSLNDKDENLRIQIEHVKDKLAFIRGDIDLNRYRIQQLEDKNKNGNRNGGAKSPV